MTKTSYDICFSDDVNMFASAGSDGSVRHFDLRDLEHSTIIYENPEALLRVAWNKKDPNILATIIQDQNKVIVLDIRYPMALLTTLNGHT